MSDVPSRDFTAALAVLFEKGIRYKTVIDVGCADGHFFLQCLDFFPDATAVNIDANPLYEPSLKAIRDVVDGHFLIAAVSDQEGEVEMTTSVHPYWSSLRPQDDPYWQRINQLHESKIKVPAATLDGLTQKLKLAPPFLLKLDIQGAEVQALRGARKMLAETSVVVCEADLDDFEPINRILVESGFGLFDLASLSFSQDNSLGWFYPVYLNRRHDGIRRRSFWDQAHNPQVVKAQADRRAAILKQSAAVLDRLRDLRKRS